MKASPPTAADATPPCSGVASRLSHVADDFGFGPGPVADPLVGAVLGDVEIVRPIAEGGMGRVYEGRQRIALAVDSREPAETRRVAVKILKGTLVSDELRQRFAAEARLLARLDHPGIARIHAAGTHEVGGVAVPAIVMEFIPDASTLVGYAVHNRLSTRQRLALFREACAAVAHAHVKGVIHRDLKPGNILVAGRFAKHPGSLDHFDWPVTPADARSALDDFLVHRLANFGRYQDAIWTGEPWLWHSRLSQAMNLKLLDPRDVVAGAERAWRKGKAPLEATEGFIRQVLGWREYVRGIYWHFMPEYLDRNALQAEAALPAFYWSAETEMNCLKDAIGQTLQYGYAHHIQRLMVTGLFAMLLGVKPQEVHRWYLAVYVDAVEWVELPNTLGMSQFADGGVMASKPYCATGAYIDRMSNACKGCRYDPKKASGPEACPFTTLYWDFLARHEKLLATNQRMTMQLKNLSRKDAKELRTIRRQADELKASLG